MFREKPESKNVKVVFGENFLKKILRNLRISPNFMEGERP